MPKNDDKKPKSPRGPEAREKQARALELARTGMPTWRIAKELGVTPRQVRFYVEGALHDYVKPAAESLIALELSRLDRMLEAVWGLAEQGDLRAVDRVLRIMERRTAYLGLDAPRKETAPPDDRVRMVEIVLKSVDGGEDRRLPPNIIDISGQ